MDDKIKFCLYGLVSSIFINRYLPSKIYFLFAIILGVIFVLKKENRIFYFTIGAILFSVSFFIHGSHSPLEMGTRLSIEGEVTKAYEKYEDFQRIVIKTKYGKFSVGVSGENTYKLYDRVNGNIVIDKINTYRNFGMTNMYDYYYQNYIINSASSDDLERIPTTSLIKNIKLRVRENIEKSIDKNTSNETAGILRKLVLADSSRLDRDINEIYSKAGVSHLFAISGLHILIIIFLIDNILLKLGVDYKTRFYIIFITILFYAFLVDFPPSINRALLMYSLKKVADMREIKISNIGIISLAALILLTLNSRYLFNIGFLLSFGSVLGINILSKRIPIRGDILKNSFNLYLSVNIFIFPFLALYFNNFNILSFVTNFFMTYVVMINLILTYISLILDNLLGISFIYRFIDITFQISNYYLARFLNLFDFTIRILNPSIIMLVIYYLFLYVILNKRYQYKIYRNRSGVYLVNLYILIFFIIKSLTPTLILGFYDVGQGDSCYLIYKDKYIQIDTGGNPHSCYNPGVEVTAKAIEKRGIDKVDLMILTHYDFDHASGVPYLIERNYVNYIIAGFRDEEHPIYVDIINSGAKILYPSNTQVVNIDKDLSLEFLNINDNFEKGNESSLVTLIDFKGRKALLVGDIGFEAENIIADEVDNIDILKVAHHGSKYSSGIDFLNKARPEFSVISVGKNNYGHPTEEVLNNLKKLGSRVLRTDEEGEIIFYISDEIKYETYMHPDVTLNLENYVFFGIIFLMLIYYYKVNGDIDEIQRV